MSAVHSAVRPDEEPIYVQLVAEWGQPGQRVIQPTAVLLAAELPRALEEAVA